MNQGPGWSDGGVGYAVDSLDKLTTGSFIDRGGTFRRIPVEEAWKRLEKMGYDRKKVEAAPPCTTKYHAVDKRRDKIVLYDSIKSRKFSRLDSWRLRLGGMGLGELTGGSAREQAGGHSRGGFSAQPARMLLKGARLRPSALCSSAVGFESMTSPLE